MRRTFFTILTTAAIIAPAGATPATLDGTIIEVCVRNGQQAFAEMDEAPTDWTACKHSSLYLHFPANANNTYSYQLYESTADSPWPPVVVTYHPQDSAITITGNDMHVDIQLSFTSATSGNADIAWHEEGVSWYVKGATFHINSATVKSGYVAMPREEESDGAVQSVDDGLGDIVRDLENRTYKSAVERLYQKRLLTILPQIMEGAPVDSVIANANGTTALHNACGLSHVELVQWLVEHGANVYAKTAKGAGVEDCVGGPNAAAIRAILRKAKNNH